MKLVAARPVFLPLLLLGLVAGPAGCTPSTNAGSDKQPAPTPGESADDSALRDRLDQVVDYTLQKRHLNTKDHAAWQIVHGILVYGDDFQIYVDGKLVPALDYLLKGGELGGWHLYRTEHGVGSKVEAGTKTGQGHEDQWLGYLSQCGISPDTQLVVNDENYTVGDLISEAQWHLNNNMEATWTLMALSTYLPLDAHWAAKDGSEWTIDRIVQLETEQDLNESSCGGTHRLYGLATAVNRYRKEHPGEKLKGPWLKAQEEIDKSIETARKFQQPDGSFSTNYFARPATSAELSDRVHSTGHTLEFVVLAADDKTANEPWVQRAAEHLTDLLEQTQDLPMECGALYHGVHGLQLYRQRRFGPRDAAAQNDQQPMPREDAAGDRPPAEDARDAR